MTNTILLPLESRELLAYRAQRIPRPTSIPPEVWASICTGREAAVAVKDMAAIIDAAGYSLLDELRAVAQEASRS